MPFEETEILEFNQHQKSDKAPFIIYPDLECLVEKIDGCKKNKHDVYRDKYFIKKFCESIREHTVNIINFEKKKMKLLT